MTMSPFFYAMAAIVLIAVVAEVNPKLGWALAALAAMGMIAAYYRNPKQGGK